MRTVWPDTFVVESGLARNISLIRRALEEHAGPVTYIETVPKRGYRFVAAITEPLTEPPPPPSAAAASTQAPLSNKQASLAPDAANQATLADVVRGSPKAPLPLPARPASRRRAWIIAGAALIPILVYAFSHVWTRPAVPGAADLQIAWHLATKVRPEETRKALALYEKVLSAHSNSAEARAGVAETLITLNLFGMSAPGDLSRAKELAEQAVRLSPDLAKAHSALGSTQMIVDARFDAAEKSFQRALQLDPNQAVAAYRYSLLLNASGRYEEALKLAIRACELDPVSPTLGVQKGLAYYSQLRFDEAAREFTSVLDRERDFTLAHYYLGLTYGFLRRFDDARRHLARAEVSKGTLRTDNAWIDLLEGNPVPAEQSYREMQKLVAEGSVDSSALILMAAWLGHPGDALNAIESSRRNRIGPVLLLRSDPRITVPLSKHPRFETVTAGIGRGWQ